MHYFKRIQKVLIILILLISQHSCTEERNDVENKLLDISESQNVIIENSNNLEVQIFDSTIPIKELKEFASVISLVAFNKIKLNESSFNRKGYVNLIFFKNKNKIFEYEINFTDLIKIQKDITILEEIFGSNLKSKISNVDDFVPNKTLKTKLVQDFDDFSVKSLDVYKFQALEDKEMIFIFLDSKKRTLKTMMELKNYQIKDYKILDTINTNEY